MSSQLRNARVWRASLLATVLAGAAAAGEPGEAPPPIETDRPDQTESSNTVPRGTFQLEVGAVIARHDGPDASTDSADWLQALGRWGLVERLELRFFWAGWGVVETDGSTGDSRARGGGDFALGVKWKLREERGAAPRMALIADSSVPGGHRDFTSKRFDPSLRLAASHTLSERVGLAYNVGPVWHTVEDGAGDRDTVSRFIYTLAAGFGVAERWGTYAEVFGSVAGSSPDRGPEHRFDAGVTWTPRPALQLDASAGLSLVDGTDDWFLGLGLSARFPR